MKKIIIAIVSMLISLLFYSCSEITDIGEVHKFPKDQPPSSPVSTVVEPDSTRWLIVEGYTDKYNNNSINTFPWGKKLKFVKNDITIDTSNSTLVLTMDIQAESSIPDVSQTDRNDRISSFRIKLDSIELNENMLNNSEFSQPNWCELYIKTIKDQKVFYMSQNELIVQGMIAAVAPGIIMGDFRIWISTGYGFQTGFCSITFDLYYPKKK